MYITVLVRCPLNSVYPKLGASQDSRTASWEMLSAVATNSRREIQEAHGRGRIPSESSPPNRTRAVPDIRQADRESTRRGAQLRLGKHLCASPLQRPQP
ncbi:unnamed protein product [Pleuronectes platessa]|uniref:Uncharacterized protein n=1 Tax=Pleuronectes platessa TaxID=8262 RepID=A0A9N7Y619_PLEPL|nr:unnamed protein product [Pleuronectes platessa]